MALLKCPQCGNDVSDKAAACPHCGSGITIAPNVQQYPNQMPNYGAQIPMNSPAPAKSGTNKTVIAVVIVIAVLIGFVAVLMIYKPGGDNSVTNSTPVAGANAVVPNPSQAGFTPSTAEKTYNVYLTVIGEKNWIFAKYDVDIFVDGQTFVTQQYGTKGEYTLPLTEGSHKIVFRENGNPSTSGEITLNVTDNMTYVCEIKGHEKYIEVTIK